MGITRNIIDCYSAIIQLWSPGDRIYLFGFSRGAYTVRCLATVICYCGIPSQAKNNLPLKRDTASATRIATEAVKSVYQHVSSLRDAQYFEQRNELAQKIRADYGCGGGGQSEFPFFIGVFDTVAALTNFGSLSLLTGIIAILLIVSSFGLLGALGCAGILAVQSFYWLSTGLWWPLPLKIAANCLKSIGSDWVGLQTIFDWILRLPLSLAILVVGYSLFWAFGVISAKLYKQQVDARDLVATPSQTHA